MKFAPKSVVALAPVLLALAACGGGTEEADGPADASPGESPSPSPSAAAAPIAAAGPPPVFNQCTACHSTDRGENDIGPSFAGLFGRRAGTLAGFEFSQAMKDSGLSWNQAGLDRYLENPRGVVPGTTMAYNGVKDAAQRQAVINYLKTL